MLASLLHFCEKAFISLLSIIPPLDLSFPFLTFACFASTAAVDVVIGDDDDVAVAEIKVLISLVSLMCERDIKKEGRQRTRSVLDTLISAERSTVTNNEKEQRKSRGKKSLFDPGSKVPHNFCCLCLFCLTASFAKNPGE
jgi:hypothetical protein